MKLYWLGVKPYLVLEPETTEESRSCALIPWLIFQPAKRTLYLAYWTRFSDIYRRFTVVAKPEHLHALKARNSIRNDLSHLTEIPYRQRIESLFHPEYKPREYQLRGIAHLIDQEGVILADETGLGKTIQSMGAAVASIGIHRDDRAIIVVCPSSLRYQWRSEIMRMLIDRDGEPLYAFDSIKVIDGAPVHRQMIYRSPPTDIVIVSYETLRKDLVDFGRWIRKRGCSTLILDESARFKSATSATYRSVLLLKRALRPRHTYCLNATPIENALVELWAQLSIVSPAIFPDLSDFYSRYIQTITIGKGFRKFTKVIGNRYPEEIKLLTRDAYIRRTYDVVADEIPPVVVAQYPVDLSAPHQAAYREYAQRRDIDGMVRIQALVRLALFTEVDGKILSPKLDILPTILEEIGDRKVVLFTESRRFAYLVVDALKKRKLKVDAIHGEVSAADRDKIQRNFAKGNLQYLVGTSAMQRGLNLQAAGWVINLDLPWNPAALKQRIGRVRRIGSKHDRVRVLNLIARDTVEEKVADVIREKHDLFDAVFGDKEEILGDALPETVIGNSK